MFNSIVSIDGENSESWTDEISAFIILIHGLDAAFWLTFSETPSIKCIKHNIYV